MSKYQNALDEIMRLATQQYSDVVYQKATKASALKIETKIYDNVSILQELVDKATPKKPRIAIIYGNGSHKVLGYYCRSCDLEINERTSGTVCRYCCQMLDWSENE